MTAVVQADTATAEELALGRRIKIALVSLAVVGAAGVLVAGQYWDYLGRITVRSSLSGDAIAVSVESLSHRPGNADLMAVVHTSAGRVLRIQSDVPVPANGPANISFDFAPLLQDGEHVTTFKVKK